MKIKNNKLVGLIAVIIGLLIIAYCLFICSVAFTGTYASAKISGYKISSNGARKVQADSKSAKLFSGRSPYVTFKTTDNKVIETYSRIPQLFTSLNYNLQDEVNIKYNESNPSRIFILSPKELPGVIFLLLIGTLFSVVGFSFLKPSKKTAIGEPNLTNG
jgi:hypothetical protein